MAGSIFGLIFAAPLAFTFQSELIERPVARQRQQPGNEWAAARLILAGVAPQVKKYVLDNFFRRRALLENAHYESVDNPGMPVVELFECAHVFTKKLLHQRRVGRLAIAKLSSYGREEHGLRSSSPVEYTAKCAGWMSLQQLGISATDDLIGDPERAFHAGPDGRTGEVVADKIEIRMVF